MIINPIDILDAREERANLQEKLIKKINLPLLVIRANYPGIDKNNEITKYLVNIIYNDILTKVLPSHTEKIDSFEGIIYLLNVDISPIELKKIMIDIEINHPLGRLVDLDVLNLDNHTISRIELGFPTRHCFICNNIAHSCVRSQKHNLEEVLKYIKEKVLNYKRGKKNV